MKSETVKIKRYFGFILTRDGGPDAPWRAWRADGLKLRADTLSVLKDLIRTEVGAE